MPENFPEQQSFYCKQCIKFMNFVQRILYVLPGCIVSYCANSKLQLILVSHQVDSHGRNGGLMHVQMFDTRISDPLQHFESLAVRLIFHICM